jgi:hypothetical protein
MRQNYIGGVPPMRHIEIVWELGRCQKSIPAGHRHAKHLHNYHDMSNISPAPPERYNRSASIVL